MNQCQHLPWKFRWGFPDVVQLLLEMGADPDAKDKSGKTAGDWAAKLGDGEMKNMLDKSFAELVR